MEAKQREAAEKEEEEYQQALSNFEREYTEALASQEKDYQRRLEEWQQAKIAFDQRHESATNEKNEAQLLDGARIAGEAHDLIG